MKKGSPLNTFDWSQLSELSEVRSQMYSVRAKDGDGLWIKTASTKNDQAVQAAWAADQIGQAFGLSIPPSCTLAVNSQEWQAAFSQLQRCNASVAEGIEQEQKDQVLLMAYIDGTDLQDSGNAILSMTDGEQADLGRQLGRFWVFDVLVGNLERDGTHLRLDRLGQLWGIVQTIGPSIATGTLPEEAQQAFTTLKESRTAFFKRLNSGSEAAFVDELRFALPFDEGVHEALTQLAERPFLSLVAHTDEYLATPCKDATVCYRDALYATYELLKSLSSYDEEGGLTTYTVEDAISLEIQGEPLYFEVGTSEADGNQGLYNSLYQVLKDQEEENSEQGKDLQQAVDGSEQALDSPQQDADDSKQAVDNPQLNADKTGTEDVLRNYFAPYSIDTNKPIALFDDFGAGTLLATQLGVRIGVIQHLIVNDDEDDWIMDQRLRYFGASLAETPQEGVYILYQATRADDGSLASGYFLPLLQTEAPEFDETGADRELTGLSPNKSPKSDQPEVTKKNTDNISTATPEKKPARKRPRKRAVSPLMATANRSLGRR